MLELLDPFAKLHDLVALVDLEASVAGEGVSPISLYSQGRLLRVESLMSSSSERSRTAISFEGTTFAAEILNCPS